jgi:hypothetical protein
MHATRPGAWDPYEPSGMALLAEARSRALSRSEVAEPSTGVDVPLKGLDPSRD